MQNQENTQPSFYAVIPANVRYDKNLEPSAKLLFGELTALCNKEGYCWASNNYFTELYCVDERTIRRWISSLSDEGYIKIEITKNGLQTVRKIFICQIKNFSTSGQKCPPRGTKMSAPGDKNVRHNNISNITNKNPPPLTPPKVDPPKGEITKEEEDFSFLNNYNFSQNQITRLRQFTSEQIKSALKLTESIKIKTTLYSVLTHILKNPENYKDKDLGQGENITPQQRMALNHNEFLKDHLKEEVYRENIETIRTEKYMIVGFFLVKSRKNENQIFPKTISCRDEVTEKTLLEEIKQDIAEKKK